MVWCQQGFGSFNIAKVKCSVLCPICKKPLIDVLNMGLYNCKYSIEGVTSDNELVKKTNLRAPIDKLLTFENSKEHRTDW